MADVENKETRLPKPHDNWEFPYGHIVWRAQDGSFMGFCEKNGVNTIFMQHGVSGSYSEINNSGDAINVTVGNAIAYNKSGSTTTTDHNSDTKGGGHGRSQMQGGIHVVVVGDAGVTVGGDTAMVGMGKVNMAAKQIYMGSGSDIAINAKGNMELKSGGTMALHSGGAMGLKSGGTMSQEAPKINHNGGDSAPEMGSDVPTS